MLKNAHISLKTRGSIRRNTVSLDRIAYMRPRRRPPGQKSIKKGNGNTGSILPSVEPRSGCSSHQLSQRTHCAFHLVGPRRPVLVIYQSLSGLVQQDHFHPLVWSAPRFLVVVCNKQGCVLPVPTPLLLNLSSKRLWLLERIPDLIKKGTIRCPEVFGRDPLSVVRYHAHFCHRQLVCPSLSTSAGPAKAGLKTLVTRRRTGTTPSLMRSAG